MANITITVPKITAVSLSPNPANTKQSVAVSVTVIEETRVLTPIPLTAGEFYAGET